MNDLNNPIFSDESRARQWLEARVWPDGPVCPHCGFGDVTALKGSAHRPGLYQCNDCRQQFTATVGTVFERSKIALTKWLMAVYLLSASKKGISTNQLSRMLGLPYKTAWFMTHRIREAMKAGDLGPLGGGGKAVEADETYIGKTDRARQRDKNVPRPRRRPRGKDKMKVLSLVERGGNVRSFKVGNINSFTVQNILFRNVDRNSDLMTDEARYYKQPGQDFATHQSVNHSKYEYARGLGIHVNTLEGYFSIFKRGMKGIYQHCSERHLQRYLTEFDFRYNTRHVTDMERAELAAQGIKGKRLTYRRTDRQAQA